MEMPKEVGPFRVIRELGHGGMGTVFLAEDPRLGRKVALKILLPSRLEGSEGTSRLLKEAKAAAKLEHPSACAIFEVGESTSGAYIAMQYVEGETIEAVLNRSRPSLGEVVSWGVQIAETLAEAHRLGIIHRDIKPQNLMVTPKGQVKVLDFGLAKVISHGNHPATSSTLLTQEGVVMGTVPYMSPEQVRGDELDGRSDIFSLASVLFEAATGRRAFPAHNSAELMSEILRVDPFWDGAGDALPPELQAILGMSLKKAKSDRYTSAEAMASDLRVLLGNLQGPSGGLLAPWLSVSGNQRSPMTKSGDDLTAAVASSRALLPLPSARPWWRAPWFLGAAGLAFLAPTAYFAVPAILARRSAIDSIAVLPFVNASGDAEREYLSEGLTESLINQLARVPGLKVIARSSVLRYKGRETDPAVLMRELGVRAVLTGRFVQREGRLTFSLELADLKENRHVWGESYTRTIPELLGIQDRIAQDVIQGLGRNFGQREKLALARGGIQTNPEAYQLYLKGRFLADQWTPESTERVLGYFDQALKVDPSFAMAHVGKAYFYWGLSTQFRPSGEMMAKVREEAQMALDLDPQIAEAYAARGLAMLILDYDAAGAEADLHRAVELNPGSASVQQSRAYLHMILGRRQECMEALKRAQELDPLSATTLAFLMTAHKWFGGYDEAILVAKKLISLEPHFWWGHQLLGRSLLESGRLEEALIEMAKASESGSNYALACKGYLLARMGRKQECQEILKEMLSKMYKKEYVNPYFLGILYSGLRDPKNTKLWLSKARENHEEVILLLVKDPIFDWLLSDPEFHGLLPPLHQRGGG